MGKTIYEMVVDWWCPPPKVEFYNPLEAVAGKSTLTVDTLDLRKYTFRIDEIRELTLDYERKKFQFTDYNCRSILEGDLIHIRVRVYPTESSGRSNQILVLRNHDTLDYDENFKALLEDQQFNTMNDEEIEASFWRINEVKTPYQARAVNGMTTTEVRYWDYWRDTADEAGTPYKEFLFVEWDKGDTGRFEIWRGEECPCSRINIM